MTEPLEIRKLRDILKGREVYTPKELVKMGLYGSKTSVHYAISNKDLEFTYITDRRIVIFKESIIKNAERRLIKMQEKILSHGLGKKKRKTSF